MLKQEKIEVFSQDETRKGVASELGLDGNATQESIDQTYDAYEKLTDEERQRIDDESKTIAETLKSNDEQARIETLAESGSMVVAREKIEQEFQKPKQEAVSDSFPGYPEMDPGDYVTPSGDVKTAFWLGLVTMHRLGKVVSWIT